MAEIENNPIKILGNLGINSLLLLIINYIIKKLFILSEYLIEINISEISFYLQINFFWIFFTLWEDCEYIEN